MSTSRYEQISPDDAQRYLGKAHTNRRLRAKAVQNLAADMTNGAWIDNGESLIFDEEGRLMDGQHRLSAVIISGKTIKFLVVRGVSSDAMHTIDSGLSRSDADVLGLRGHLNSTILASALLLLSAWNKGWRSALKRGPRQELVALLEANPTIEASVSVAASYGRGFSRACVAFAHFMCAAIDRSMADAFFDDLRSGVGLEADDPVLHLRNRLLGETKFVTGTQGRWKGLALIFRAWNMKREGRTVGKSPPLPRPSDKFPEPQ